MMVQHIVITRTQINKHNILNQFREFKMKNVRTKGPNTDRTDLLFTLQVLIAQFLFGEKKTEKNIG